MKKKLLLSFLLNILIISAYSQPSWQWARSSSGSFKNDGGRCIAVDENGNSYVAGYFFGPSIIFDTITLANYNNGIDIFLVKYGNTGDVVWAKRFGGNSGEFPNGISLDAYGNIYLVGTFSSDSINFGAFTVHNIVSTTAEIFTAKFDTAGTVLWAKNGIGSSTTTATAVTSDFNGNCYVTGFYYGSTLALGGITLTNNTLNGTPDFFIVKYDQFGNVVWAQSAGGNDYDEGYGITTDADGNIYVTGEFVSPSITFGSFTLADSESMFIVKYDPTGNVLWAKKEGGNNGYDIGFSIAVDSNKNLFVVGVFQSPTITIGSTTLTNANSFSNDFFIVKYDSAGAVQWAKGGSGFSIDVIYQIVTDKFGNAYIIGRYDSPTLTIDNITLTNSTSSLDKGEIIIAKIAPFGQLVWAKSLGGVRSDCGYSLDVDTTNNLYITGDFASDALVLDTITINNFTSGFDSTDFYIAKMNLDAYCSAYFSLYPDIVPQHWYAINQATGFGNIDYSWSWGDGDTSTGATPSHNYATPGFYNICLTINDADGCTSTYCDSSTYINRDDSGNAVISINVIMPNTTGIQQLITDKHQVNVYPNPSAGTMIASFPFIRDGEIEIYNILGRAVYSEKINNEAIKQIHINDISSGIYFMKIFDGEKSFCKKMIIESK